MKLLKSLRNCTLHPHQIEGVQWLIDHWSLHENVIVADEMGLGKTLQSLAFFCYLLEENLSTGPFLVIAPLSVAPQWRTQAEKFVPSLKTLLYLGSGEEREEMRRCTVENRDGRNVPFDLLVTSYETCVSDIEFVSEFPWRTIVFDEGHRLKNPQGKTHATLLERLHADFKMILTGTPVQNNVTEFWALLRFLNPDKFPESTRPGTWMPRISEYVNTYVLRRLFSATSSISLPPIDQLVIRTEMTTIQTDLYRWALFHYAKSTCGASEVPAGILSNLMMTLRKIASHPYLIGGVEPEPFSEGPHIWMNSNKFRILRLLLLKMRNEDSKCLIFSNFTSLLDICQDFLDLEGIPYERLDGSVRREDRTDAINRFSSDNEKKEAFLLSTRAGGVGLNLTAANWVIFLDTDWNPQMDLQAIARAFRQGQEKRVKVFRLITRGTVDEVIFSRALEKLNFANKILHDADADVSPRDMKELILKGISQLKGSQDPAGPMPRASRGNVASEDEDIETLIESLDKEERDLLVVVGKDEHNYKKFEGVDYSELKSADIEAMDRLTQHASAGVNGKKISPNLVNRIKGMTQENRLKRKLEKWSQIGYTSFALENVGDLKSPDPSVLSGEISHLHGSFVDLENKQNNGVHIVVHLVDSSGIWPTASRLFMSLAKAFPVVPKYYFQAKKAADLRLGDLHLIPITEGGSVFVALCVCKTADEGFVTCLRKLSNRFNETPSPVNIHFSRIGDQRGTLYITERLIGKYLCAFGFNAFIYYYKRDKKEVEKNSTIFDYFKKKISSFDEKISLPSKSPLVSVHFSPLILPVLRDLYARDISSIGGTAVHTPPADIYVVSFKEGKEGINKIAKSLGVPVETSIPETPLKKDGVVRIILTTQLEHVLLGKRNSSYH